MFLLRVAVIWLCSLLAASFTLTSMVQPLCALQQYHHFTSLTIILPTTDVFIWQLTRFYRQASSQCVFTTNSLILSQLLASHDPKPAVRPLYILMQPSCDSLVSVLRRPEVQGVFVGDGDSISMCTHLQVPWYAPIFILADGNHKLLELAQRLPNSPVIPTVVAHSFNGQWMVVANRRKHWSHHLDLTGVTVTIVEKSQMSDAAAVHRTNKEFPNTGFVFELWQVLMQQLNFRTWMLVSDVDIGQPQGDGNWTGILGTLQRGDVDVCINPMMPISERADIIHVLRVGLVIENRIFIMRPQFKYSWKSSVHIFSLGVWLAFLGTSIMITFTLWGVLSANRETGLEANRWKLSNCCMLVVSCLCAQGSDITPQSMSGRIVHWVCLVFAYCISQYYSSVLVSQLTAQTSQLPFEDLEQFLAVGTYNMAMFPQLAPTRFAEAATSGVMKQLWDGYIRGKPDALVEGMPTNVLPRLCAGQTALFAPTISLATFLDASPCEIIPLKPVYFKTSSGMITRKDFPYLAEFNYVFQRMLEVGVLGYINNKYFAVTTLSSEVPLPEAISLAPVLPIFFMFGFGMLLAGILLLLEMSSGKTKPQVVTI